MPEEYRANFGTPEQLPAGAASDVNESLNAAPPPVGGAGLAETSSASPAPISDDSDLPATPADFEPVYQPETEEDDFLTGPTMRPDEAQFVGAEAPRSLSPVVRRQLPLLQQAALEPGASAELQALVSYLLRRA